MTHAATVILGASNVSRGLGVLVRHARAVDGGAQRILVAAGRGRSYGIPTRMLGRSLCGIVESEVWTELARTDGPVRALLTDVGNDVMFGVSNDTLCGWLDTCLGRLAAREARTVVTALPLERLLAMSRRSFSFWKRVFFPARHLQFDRVREQLRELDGQLRDLAAAHGAHVAEPDPGWYGLDPIHIRHRHVAEAWADMLTPWGPVTAAPRLSAWHRARLSFLPARGCRIWGRPQRGAERRYPDGAELLLC